MAIRKETVYGSIGISDETIGTIAANEAVKCVGVVGMAFKSKTDEFVSLIKKAGSNRGVKVFSGNGKLSLELHIIAEYGVNLNAISNNIIESVRYAVENMTGFEVDNVTVNVDSIRVRKD